MTRLPIMLTLLCALLITSNNNNALGQKPCSFRARVGEAGLRKQKATKKVTPVYPEESVKNKVTGKVVVEILVDESGKVSETKVKEAPDKLTGQAVVDAAKLWEFQTPPKVQGRQICYTSTLSFMFEIKNGKGKIADAPIN